MTQKMPSFEGAACATPLGRQLFSDETGEYTQTCRQICASCPVQRGCRQWGVLHEREGMWGGLDPEELAAERRQHQIHRDDPPVPSMRVLLQQQAVAAKRAGVAS